MAKGLRSKSKRKFKTIRRNEIYAPVEDARTERLAEKQAALAQAPSVLAEKIETEHLEQNVNMEDDMNVESATPKSKLEMDRLFLSRRKFKAKVKEEKKQRSKNVKVLKGKKRSVTASHAKRTFRRASRLGAKSDSADMVIG
ncbi:hypothetical protein HK098_008393 [Nowakowskiella sp. JEL0407]|nr:hypothetical protein HK098_008383 [Nowakowskiella sp. JEL0407]KAJ3125604.1 hypothetical protein HK098_008393 [Nowakowskiella sp. JEL0407]